MSEVLSPFSPKNEYQLIWNKNGSVEMKKRDFSDNQKKVLERLGEIGFATRFQLVKQFSSDLKRGKHVVDMMMYRGVLVRHILHNTKNDQRTDIYTLSSGMAEIIEVEPVTKPNVPKLLRKLLLMQLLMRFLEIDPETIYLPFPKPFHGAFHLLGLDFRIGLIGDESVNVLQHFLKHDEEMRTILVVEELQNADRLKEEALKQRIRVITHADLINKDLSRSFYFYDSQRGWVQEDILLLDNKRELVDKKNK